MWTRAGCTRGHERCSRNFPNAQRASSSQRRARTEACGCDQRPKGGAHSYIHFLTLFFYFFCNHADFLPPLPPLPPFLLPLSFPFPSFRSLLASLASNDGRGRRGSAFPAPATAAAALPRASRLRRSAPLGLCRRANLVRLPAAGAEEGMSRRGRERWQSRAHRQPHAKRQPLAAARTAPGPRSRAEWRP